MRFCGIHQSNQATVLYEFENYTFKITDTSLKDQMS